MPRTVLYSKMNYCNLIGPIFLENNLANARILSIESFPKF